ncbi:MAG: ATP-binding protein [Spirulina sp. SIO3F2]|nr:ATP-binding protein [Spirulina sp. SIO3F2]
MEMETKIFGEYLKDLADLNADNDCLEMSFTPTAQPIKQRWTKNKLSADFVSDYFLTFIPISDEEDSKSKRKKKLSKGSINYIANELLENAMKFNDHNTKYKIRFGIYFVNDSTAPLGLKIVLYATNAISSKTADKFESFIIEFLESDLDDLFMRQMGLDDDDDDDDDNDDDENESSGLGFITMCNDHEAKLGWEFDTISHDPPIRTVTTMAQLTV